MNPYEQLPPKAFWKLAVADRSLFDISELWEPKFHIKKKQNVVTFGSCFAQHIGNALKNRGFNWLNTEKAPFGLSVENSKKYNYGIFSSRTGNIYTTTLLKQWTEWALGNKVAPDEVWEKDGRFYDPFRPRIEPNGFISKEELLTSRQQTIESFKQSIKSANYFVFTLGLTESWLNKESGIEYPMCPGTVAGVFNEEQHKFVNLQFSQILKSLRESIELMRGFNPKIKFILTVSPVPLTATNSGKHVAVATMASKSILRAVTDQLSNNKPYVDYFPSYEIINSPIFKGTFFEPNQRSVNPVGVNFVMDSFFNCLEEKFGLYKADETQKTLTLNRLENARCEEELLEAFGK